MQKITFKDYPDTTTPLNANNLNQMQEDIESAIDDVSSDLSTSVDELNAKVSYSSNETVVGTWIDGTPVYRKVLQTNGETGSDVNIAHGITNLKKVIDFKACSSNGSTNYMLNNASGFVLQVKQINTTNIVMNIATGFGNGWPIVYVIDYIKEEGE